MTEPPRVNEEQLADLLAGVDLGYDNGGGVCLIFGDREERERLRLAVFEYVREEYGDSPEHHAATGVAEMVELRRWAFDLHLRPADQVPGVLWIDDGIDHPDAPGRGSLFSFVNGERSLPSQTNRPGGFMLFVTFPTSSAELLPNYSDVWTVAQVVHLDPPPVVSVAPRTPSIMPSRPTGKPHPPMQR